MNKASSRGGPVAVAEAKSQARRVTLKVEDLIPEVKEKPRRQFWLGTLPSCPYQTIHVAGTTFPRFMGNPQFDKNGEPMQEVLPGCKVPLDEDQVERIMQAVANRVLRPIGNSDRASLLLRTGTHRRGYTPQKGDQPLGRFLYMYDVTDGFPSCYHGGKPEPMVE